MWKSLYSMSYNTLILFLYYRVPMKKIWTKRIPSGRLLIITITSLLLFGCSQSTPTEDTTAIQTPTATVNETQNYSQLQSKISADKIQLYHFRGTNQCWTCITLWELTLKTLEESFAEEVKSGKITYEDINAELPENQALAQKFGVRNISLYINTIIGESESYEEQVDLMRYLNNEEQFKQMLKEKLNWFLGK